MPLQSRPARRIVAFVVAVLLGTSLLAVPLLDLGRAPRRLAIDAKPTQPGWLAHDHDLCLWFGATPWAPPPSPPPPATLRVHQATVIIESAVPGELLLQPTYRSRAPPTA